MAGDIYKITQQLIAKCAVCERKLVVRSVQEGAGCTIWAQIEPCEECIKREASHDDK